MVRPLLFSPSPRDIPEVYEALKSTGHDRVYSKYFPSKLAFNLGRQYFLANPEYTHFVVCPDDLVTSKKVVDNLIKHIEEKDPPIHAGVCNVDDGAFKDLLNVSYNLPHPTRPVPARNQVGWRCFQWMPRVLADRRKERIITVPHSGFAVQFIRRDIVEQFEFTDDSEANNQKDYTFACDVMFSNSCAKRQIPITVDLDAWSHHLRSNQYSDIELGEGEVRFYKANQDEYEVTFKQREPTTVSKDLVYCWDP